MGSSMTSMGGAGGGGGAGGMGGMMGGGGAGGMGGMDSMFPKNTQHLGSNHGRGEVCGESTGSNVGKWIGTIVGTVAGAYFGMPGLGIVGGKAGSSIGSQVDPNQCVSRMNPNEFANKRPPMPPGGGPGGTQSSATESVTTPATESSPFMSVTPKGQDDEDKKDPYDEMARRMTYGGSNPNDNEYWA